MNFPEPDDAGIENLLSRCASHDHTTLEELYEKIAPQLLAPPLRMLRTRELAEGALEEVFVRVWGQAGQFEPAPGASTGVDDWHFSLLRH